MGEDVADGAWTAPGGALVAAEQSVELGRSRDQQTQVQFKKPLVAL